MDENKQPTKEEEAAQAGKNIAEVAANGAANLLGGPVGGAITRNLARTEFGQKALNTAGKIMASSPLTKNALAKAQPAIQKAKPALGAVAGGLGGNTSDATKSITDTTEGASQSAIDAANSPSDSNPLTSSSSSLNNSGFGNNKSGLFSTSRRANEEAAESGSSSASAGLANDLKKAKKIIGIVSAAAPIVLPMIMLMVVAFVVVGQIRIVAEKVEGFIKDVNVSIEKYINFAQGEGWVTNEESFFNTLNKEYKKFPYMGGEKLDIALIASTIHYSTTVDLEQFEVDEGGIEDVLTGNSSPILGTLGRDETVDFYEVAKDKLGSYDSPHWGGKRLLGYAVKTDVSFDWYTGAEWAVAVNEWRELLNFFSSSIKQVMGQKYWTEVILTLANPLKFAAEFNKIYIEMQSYLITNGSILAGYDYDKRNEYYEVQEFVYLLGNIFENTKDVKVYDEEPEEKKGTAWILAPDFKRTMNYGHEEYKQMKQDLQEMKAILTKSGVDFENDEDVLNHVKNSSNTELKKLYESYRKNESAYMYSYTHYLQKVYIPFTYFYKKDTATPDQIDAMVDEIFDQKEYYYYLMGEENLDYSCGGSCQYSVGGKEVSNLKVRLLQCSDKSLGDPIPGEELVDFEKYVLGVVYAEIGPDAPVEAAKAQAIAARSYALVRPKNMGNAAGLKLEQENDQWILSIRNCVEDQVYCDPDQGCSSEIAPNGYNAVTMYSGVNSKVDPYKGPLAEDAKIRSAVSEVAGKVLLDEKGNIVSTGYTNVNQERWKSQAKSGMDYTEILLADYSSGKTLSESSCSNVCNKATGDYTQWKQLTSLGAPWGEVVIGNNKTINQIGCLVTSVSIQIARSGVPLQNINGEFNPGTFVEAIKPEGFASGVNFVWNSITKVAPTFKYQPDSSAYFGGMTKAQKAAKVKELINQGCYLVMEVKSGCGGEHWVAVDYVEGDEVYMMDPASTESVAWNQYNHSCTTQVQCYKVSE